MFTSLLAPVDFSDDSLNAFSAAIALAAHGHGRVTLLHVAHPLLVQAAAAAGQPAFVKDDIERDLCAVAARTTAALGVNAPPIDVRVAVGDPVEQILAAAANADVIVMGTRGVSGVRKLFFGSVTEHVLRQAPVPVLAVPLAAGESMRITSDGPRFDFARVLAPVDFGDGTIANARAARDTARAFGVPLLLLHVVAHIESRPTTHHALEPQERILLAHARDRMRHLVADLGGADGIESLVVSGAPSDEISAIAAERHAGLIVMGLTGTGGLLGARPGSIAYRVLCLATTPVLALPPETAGAYGSRAPAARHHLAKTASK